MEQHLPRTLLLSLATILAACTSAPREEVYTPKKGVICDKYICADNKGISTELTAQYLGAEAAQKIMSQGEFNTTEFTLMNGIFCDTKERLCRVDRYFSANGQRSAVSDKYTKMLFGD